MRDPTDVPTKRPAPKKAVKKKAAGTIAGRYMHTPKPPPILRKPKPKPKPKPRDPNAIGHRYGMKTPQPPVILRRHQPKPKPKAKPVHHAAPPHHTTVIHHTTVHNGPVHHTTVHGSSHSSHSSGGSSGGSSRPAAKPAPKTAAKKGGVDPLTAAAQKYVDGILSPQLSGMQGEANDINRQAGQSALNLETYGHNQQSDLTKLYGDLVAHQKTGADASKANLANLATQTGQGYDTLLSSLQNNANGEQQGVTGEANRLGLGGQPNFANNSRATDDASFLQGLAQVNKQQGVSNINSDAAAQYAADQSNIGLTQTQGQNYVSASKAGVQSQLGGIENARQAAYNKVLDQYTQLSGSRGQKIDDYRKALEEQQYQRQQDAEQSAWQRAVTEQGLNLKAAGLNSTNQYNSAKLQADAKKHADDVAAQNADRQLKARTVDAQNKRAAAALAEQRRYHDAVVSAKNSGKGNGGFRTGTNGAKDFFAKTVPDPKKRQFLNSLMDRISNNATPYDPKNAPFGFNQSNYADLPHIIAAANHYVQVNGKQYADATTANMIATALQVYFGKFT